MNGEIMSLAPQSAPTLPNGRELPKILQNKKVLIVVGGGVLIGLGLFAVIMFGKPDDFASPTPQGGTAEDDMVVNPLNGVKLPLSEREKVLGRRPIVVMVGNNVDARPPSNISKADLVYEAVAEGGITRFMPVFLSQEPDKVGPVRSIRAYFLYWVMELGDAMVMHDGWSSSPVFEASAIDLIDTYQVRSLFRGGLYGYRDTSRDAPNNEYISLTVAREHGNNLGWEGVRDFTYWKFKEDKNKLYDLKPTAADINIVFWTPGDYDSRWLYDPEKNLYLKSTGGVPHMDLETGQQLSATNVIVQFAKETSVNDEKNHLLYDNVGSGDGLVFIDGKAIQATWVKNDIRSRTMFYDLDGEEIKFNRGVIWISVVPDRNKDQVTFN